MSGGILITNLNTSHVNVQCEYKTITIDNYSYLNTSHVNVQSALTPLSAPIEEYLNTSHVNVQYEENKPSFEDLFEFKYISC